MPVFDLYAFGKGLARVAVYLGLFLFVAGVAVSLVAMGQSIIDVYIRALDGVGSAFNSSTLPPCIGHIMDLLGLDVFISSALSSVIGLGLLWAGFVVQITVISFSFNMKKMLAKAVQ